jgi:hypothetical protein
VDGAIKIMKLRCGHAASVWREEPPTSHNAYRVECRQCGKFEKWGTNAELKRLLATGDDVKVVPYEEPDAGPNLDDFITY